MLLKPSQLTILTTSQCTAACGHCSMHSGPGRRERLKFPEIRRAIDELHALNRLAVVIFAGGEPTLLGDDLLDAIAHADALGMNTRIVTNAYWAVSPAKAREKLVELREAGLSELNVSADDFHLPYIPFERVEHAWRAAKGLGFRAVVIANCYGPRSVVTPEFIMERLGERLRLRFDAEGRSQPLGPAAADGTLYALSNSYLQRLGRAHTTVGSGDLIFPAADAELDQPCPWAVRSAALSPQNHLVACCGMEAENNAVLDFGSADEHSLAELVHRADDDVIVNAIALKGPMFVKRFIQQRAPAVAFRDRYASVCEICEHIVTRRETVAVLREHAGALAAHVLLAREHSGEAP